MLSASFGIGTGITTYAENIAIMSVTKVASRITMQVAGLFLLIAGIFSKFSAVLAMIPEPVIGGVLAIGICMVNGVMLRNLTVLFGLFLPVPNTYFRQLIFACLEI